MDNLHKILAIKGKDADKVVDVEQMLLSIIGHYSWHTADGGDGWCIIINNLIPELAEHLRRKCVEIVGEENVQVMDS